MTALGVASRGKNWR